jgi:hypothetical protein
MSLGERISPFSISNIRDVPLNVEPLSDARTPLADCFSILLERSVENCDALAHPKGTVEKCGGNI